MVSSQEQCRVHWQLWLSVVVGLGLGPLAGGWGWDYGYPYYGYGYYPYGYSGDYAFYGYGNGGYPYGNGYGAEYRPNYGQLGNSSESRVAEVYNLTVLDRCYYHYYSTVVG